MDVIIRQATSQDYGDICALLKEVDELHRLNLPERFRKPDGPPRDEAYIHSLIADPIVGLFVAEADVGLVGLIHVDVRETPDIPILVSRRYACIHDLVVSSPSRRRGIGRALMHKAHEWAASKGAAEVELNVYEFNHEAIDFYRELGYSITSHEMCRDLKTNVLPQESRNVG